MSQGGSEATRAFLDSVTLLLKFMEVVTKAYENKNYKKELDELKKDKDSAIAKKCGAFRGALNEFYEENFIGEWKDHENKETGQRYKLFEIKKDENGIPLLKEGSPLHEASLGLIAKAQKNANTKDEFVNNLTKETNKFFTDQVVPKFKQKLKDTGNKELEQYANTIKDDTNIKDIFRGAENKAEQFNGRIKEQQTNDFLSSRAAPLPPGRGE